MNVKVLMIFPRNVNILIIMALHVSYVLQYSKVELSAEKISVIAPFLVFNFTFLG